MLVQNLLLMLLAGTSCCFVLAEQVTVEEYIQQHRVELSAITPAERNRQITVWNAHSSMLKEKDLTSPVKNKKTDKKTKIRGKRQVNIHPDSCYLLIANRVHLLQFQNVPTRRLNVVHTGLSNAVAVDFDKRNDYLFWSDVTLHRIYRSHGNGSAVTILVDSNITTPDGIAWDWISQKLYWTDADDHDLEVYDPSSSYRKILFQFEDTNIPRAIVLDPSTGWMFWTDWGTPAKILRASMDGQSFTTLHDSGLRWPNCLTMDYEKQVLYWMDAGFGKLESSHVNGSQRTLLSSLHIYHPFSMGYFQGNLFWSDWYLNAILSTPLEELNEEVYITLGNLTVDPMGMATACIQRQQNATANPCEDRCTGLCLLSSSPQGYSCQCAERQNRGNTGNGCSQPCSANGQCIGNKCSCNSGWRGAVCDKGVCSDACVHGECIAPNRCKCDAGWEGANCERAFCCADCIHGNCTAPDVCTCQEGWEGKQCEKQICGVVGGCLNGGSCKGNDCDCAKGYSGKYCESSAGGLVGR